MNLAQLRKQITDDFNAAIKRIDWLEAYEKRIADTDQRMMTGIDQDAQVETRKAATTNGKSKAAIIDEAIKLQRADFSADDLIALGHAKHPKIDLGKKYVTFVLYKKSTNPKGDVKLHKKGTAGMPNRYVRKDLSAVNGTEKGAAT